MKSSELRRVHLPLIVLGFMTFALFVSSTLARPEDDAVHSALARLQARRVDYGGRQPQRRKADFRRGQRLGYEDHRIEWTKPPRPTWMDEAASQQVPER